MFNLCSFNVESSNIGSITGGSSFTRGVSITGGGSIFAITSFEIFTKVSSSDLVSVFSSKITYKLFNYISNIKYLSLNLMPLI